MRFMHDLGEVSPIGAWPTVVGGAFMLIGMVVVALDERRGSRWLAGIFFAGTLLWLIVATMRGGSDVHGVNLVPGRGIRSEWDNTNRTFGFFNLVGNVLVFVPAGWLALIVLRRGIPSIVLGGALFSAAIECTQYVVGRSSDIDDVILNALGVAVGAGGAWLLRRAVHGRPA